MITLACAKCGATLTVDDGFAGGTCRCATCGTIQTVPARGAGVTDDAGRPIFERAGDVAVASTVPRGPFAPAIDEPRPRAARASRPPPTPGRRTRAWPAVVLVGVTGAVAVAMAVLLWKRLEKVATQSPMPTEPLVTPATRRAAATLADGPRFASIRLDRPGAIAYLIDRDAATAPFADGIRREVLASIASLPPDRPTTIRFCSADGDAAIAQSGKAGSGAWTDLLASWPATRPTDLAASLRSTLVEPVDEVVLITGVDNASGDRLADVVGSLRGGRTRVHTVSLGTPDVPAAMAKLSASTGGDAIALTMADLSRPTAEGR